MYNGGFKMIPGVTIVILFIIFSFLAIAFSIAYHVGYEREKPSIFLVIGSLILSIFFGGWIYASQSYKDNNYSLHQRFTFIDTGNGVQLLQTQTKTWNVTQIRGRYYNGLKAEKVYIKTYNNSSFGLDWGKQDEIFIQGED